MELTAHQPPSSTALVIALREQLDVTLARHLAPGTRAALINFPNHNNVGDSAIYVGTLMTLRRLGVKLSYRCDHRTYSRDSLASDVRRGTDVILINGGGNLGDQYAQQEARERVLADFPTVRTVQLPQSIWFESQARAERFAELTRRHADLTLLLRDTTSLERARREFSGSAEPCPDMALGLGPLPRPRSPDRPIVWLKRSDRESGGDATELAAGGPDTPEPVDWLNAPEAEALGGRSGAWLLRANRLIGDRIARVPPLWRVFVRTFEPLARRRLDYGLRLLAAGDVVVTDRLHGVILGLLMGIPVVAVDSRTGKVSTFLGTWLQDEPSVRLAPTHAHGLAAARQLGEATVG